MGSVVLRCPNCGTIQAMPGECDACHEAQVGYFCTNHNPGQWLTSSKCPQCGAQFGAADPVRRAAPLRPEPVRPERPRTPPPPATRRKLNPWGPTSPSSEIAERDVLAGRLRDMLTGASRGPRVPDPISYDTDSSPVPAARRGCLGPALWLALLFFGLLVLLVMFAAGPFLQIILGLLLSSHR
jgi:predicted RNA-binding Zn-ribbon protein involved in translation (DUF1610 family)